MKVSKFFTAFILASLFSLQSCKEQSSETTKTPDAQTVCYEEITTSKSGTISYKNVGGNEDCPEPTPQDEANADRAAMANMRAYGQAWCENNTCGSGKSCRPTITETRNTGYVKSSRPAPEGKKDCLLTSTISAKVSCYCRDNNQ